MQRILQTAIWASLVMVGTAKQLSIAEWYDGFSTIYDAGELRYRPFRLEARRQLRLAPGQIVMDVACGTGQNFDLMLGEIAPNGQLIGVDYSTGMLRKAEERIKNTGINKLLIHLIHADVRELSLEMLRASLAKSEAQVDRIVCTFGLAVVPDWEVVFDRMWALLAPGGRCTLMDGYLPYPKQGLHARIVNGLSRSLTRADVTRPFWLPLQSRCQDYEEKRYPYKLGTQLIIASGTKPQTIQDDTRKL